MFKTKVNEKEIELEVVHENYQKYYVLANGEKYLQLSFSDEEIDAIKDLKIELEIDKRGIGLDKPIVFKTKQDALDYLNNIPGLITEYDITENCIVDLSDKSINEGCYLLHTIL